MPEREKISIYFDGASKGNPGPAGAGAAVLRGSSVEKEIKKYLGIATNNQAEYSALLLGLQAARDLGAKEVEVFGDSELVIFQLLGRYQIRDEKLKLLYQQVVEVGRGFDKLRFTHVPREKNKLADALANEAVRDGAAPTVKVAPAKQNGAEPREAWVELRVGSAALIPAARHFIEEVLGGMKLAGKSEPAASILQAVDKALAELRGSDNGLCIRLFCDKEVAHVELETEWRKPLIYQHFKIPLEKIL